MAQVLKTALDPLHKSGEGWVCTSVHRGRMCRAHAPQKWGVGGISRPRPWARKWPG